MGSITAEFQGSTYLRGLQEVATDASTNRILILSDIRFLREGLAEVLARSGAFDIAATTAHVGDALAISSVALIQIILIDAALPNGLAAARRFHELGNGVHIVPLALSETEADVLAWAEAGATGYIPRTVALDDLVLFLQEIVSGQQACSTQVAAGLMRWVSRASRANSAPSVAPTTPLLTAREEQVIDLIGAGLSNKEISRRLNIGPATTKSHVHNVLGKLELRRRGQVARWSRDNAAALYRGTTSVSHIRTDPLPHPSPSLTTRKMDTASTERRPH
jgi:two-component system nitrate/nitrite response regulator NarL